MAQFYNELKDIRVSKEISIEDLETKTKINVKYLNAIEQGDFDILPTPYLRLFIRAYAVEIGGNAERALEQLDSFVGNNRPTAATSQIKNTDKEESKIDDANNANADVVGGDDLVEKIKNGELNFEKLICTPSMMIKLSKLGKVLGPKGLMPNPKLGTVTNDISKAVKEAKAGQVEIRNDKDGNIGLSIGKKSFEDDKLIKNYLAVIDALEKEKSNLTIKGDLVKQVFITSSMGVSYKLKLDKSF